MSGRRPIIRVTVDGQPVGAGFYSRLISARVRDEEGQVVDTCELVFDDAPPHIELPRLGAEIRISLGYEDTIVVERGRFRVDSTPLRGSVQAGETLSVHAKSADMRKDMKGEGRKAYKNQTLRQIVEVEAAKMGLQAVVDPELGAIQFPWLLRWDQSRMDFITRLADEVGGIVKPAGGRLIVQKQGSGLSASGKPLAPIIIHKDECSEWEINPDGRMQYGTVIATWIDPASGKSRREKLETGLSGPELVLREPFETQARAKAAARAEKERRNRNTANGSFTVMGRPEAQAGAPVTAIGFRDGISGEWRATVVEDVFESGDDGGYDTIISVKPPNAGKAGKDG